jgi:hypothetical protein
MLNKIDTDPIIFTPKNYIHIEFKGVMDGRIFFPGYHQRTQKKLTRRLLNKKIVNIIYR